MKIVLNYPKLQKNNATGINIQINQNTSTADNLKLLKEIAKVGPEIIGSGFRWRYWS